MNVLLLTVHRTLNYGSVLQTFACKKIFTKLGYDMVVADYSRPTDYSRSSVSNIYRYYILRKNIKNAISIPQKAQCLITSIASFPFTKRFWNNCNTFLDTHVSLSKEISTSDELAKLSDSYSIICSGSDQIWNSDYNNGTDEVFLLSFTPDTCCRISLASSIGKEDLNEKDMALFKSFLPRFKAVSVREKRAKELLEGIGIEAKQVLDPTLWIDYAEWSKEASERKVKEPYLLFYKLKADAFIDRVAEVIASKHGLKIVKVCFSNVGQSHGQNVENIVLPKIEEFISLFMYADYIVTNSFHGTCFSINFNKPFISVARERFNSRIESILEMLDLKDRIVFSESELQGLAHNNTIIDYNHVNEILENERNNAYRWLKHALIDEQLEKTSE